MNQIIKHANTKLITHIGLITAKGFPNEIVLNLITPEMRLQLIKVRGNPLAVLIWPTTGTKDIVCSCFS